MPKIYIEVPTIVVKQFEVETKDAKKAFEIVYKRTNDKDPNIKKATIIESYDDLENCYISDGYGQEWGPDEIIKWAQELDEKNGL